MKKSIFILFMFFSVFAFSQEMKFYGFYQTDRMYAPRLGVSLGYEQKISNIFAIEISSDYQYINSEYSNISSYTDYPSEITHHPKVNMTNIGFTFRLTLAETKKLKFSLGSRPHLYYFFGKDYIKTKEYHYIEEQDDPEIIENERIADISFFKFASSPVFEFKIKNIFTPKLSLNFDISTGYIIDGTNHYSCLLSFLDIWAPAAKIGLGFSYNIN